MRKVLNSTNFEVINLNPIEVDYIPGNIRTVAVQITRENIGVLAIEANAEVLTNSSNHVWCPILLERTNDQGDKVKIERAVVPGECLLVLRGEIYLFPEDVFWGTFCKVAEPEPAHRAEDVGTTYDAFTPDSGVVESLQNAGRAWPTAAEFGLPPADRGL